MDVRSHSLKHTDNGNKANKLQWVLIDMEHGNIDDKDMYHMVGGIAAAGYPSKFVIHVRVNS